ncbi:MAG: SPOR domain-containing protein [Nitrospinota bacterium]|nr:SPOR domain-containing protein [Nitrospinota bacterium]
MVYQSLKFFVARVGITFLLVLTLGFFALYFIHEVALPQMQFDDTVIQWVLLGVCFVFGFFAYGLVGEQKFINALHSMKDVGLQDDIDEVIEKFKHLVDFSYTSYFLPRKGKFYRDQVIRKYADFLLSVGRRDSPAMKIYLKAFLQNPKGSRFRAPLLSFLTVGGELTRQETDLLMVMLKAEDYNDEIITNHLARVFIKEKRFSGKTEPIFLEALENNSEDSRNIIDFVLPLLLERQRNDEFAVRFYSQALKVEIPQAVQVRELMAKYYCEGIFKAVNPVLHEECKMIFDSLAMTRQESIRQLVEGTHVWGKLKKVKLFTREDRKELQRLKERLGITETGTDLTRRGLLELIGFARKVGRRLVIGGLDLLIAFSRFSLKGKLIATSFLFMVVLLGVSYKEWYVQQENIISGGEKLESERGKRMRSASGKEDVYKVYTIQVAAVTKAAQADRLIRKLKKKGMEGLYIIKSQRKAGGNWYKIRTGQFIDKDGARKFANRLVDQKAIRNYFIIALPKNSPS